MGQFEDAGNRSLPQAADWLKCVICQRETTANLSVLLAGNGITLVLIHYF